MSDYDASTYGDRIADVYDDWFPRSRGSKEEPECLAELAGRGPVLELGIGTGRVAVPLAERGLEVHGVEASQAMVDRLREKPGGDRVQVTLGDFSRQIPDGPFSLVFAIGDSLFLLESQADQVGCFQRVERVLADEGVFVVEGVVPGPVFYERRSTPMAEQVDPDRVRFHVTRHDPVRQWVDSAHVVLSPEHGIQLYPIKGRYAWPSELDLMAQLAGLRLRERWASWRRDPLLPTSARHVSVYERI